jgi:hypothetical protein
MGGLADAVPANGQREMGWGDEHGMMDETIIMADGVRITCEIRQLVTGGGNCDLYEQCVGRCFSRLCAYALTVA